MTGAHTVSGSLDMGLSPLLNLPPPSGPNDPVTKAYGDANYTGGGGGPSAVTSVFGRAGAVLAESGDYTGIYADDVTHSCLF